MCEYRVGVDLINELLRKSGGGDGLFKEGYLKPFKELDIKNCYTAILARILLTLSRLWVFFLDILKPLILEH